jgi:hypothetical protein
MDNNGINDLISKYFEGVSTDSEKQELIRTLSDAAEHRKLFMREAMLRAEMQEWASQKLHQLQVEKEEGLETEGETASDTSRRPAPQVSVKSASQPRQHVTQETFTSKYLRESARSRWGYRLAALAASLAIIAGGYWFLNRGGPVNQPGYVVSASAMASVQTVNGSVELVRMGKTVQVETGMTILDQDVITASSNGRAEVKYAGEQTTVALLSGTTAKLQLQNEAKLVRLDAGTLVCSIAKQPKDKQMRFVTPHVTAEVVGTELKLMVANAETRLEVIEGKVKLTGKDEAATMVSAGEFAVAADGKGIVVQSATTPSPGAKPVAALADSADRQTKWPNGIPSDPIFFPIWVWDQDPADAAAYKQAGINMYVNPCTFSEVKLSQLAAAGMKAICEQDAVAMKHINDKTIVGWFSYDQPDVTRGPDGNWRMPAMEPSAILARYNGLRAKDASRPIYLALSEGVVRPDFPARNERKNHPEDYREFAKGADIVGLHMHPVNEPEPPIHNSLWYLAQGVDNLRVSSGGTKPVWSGIECTRLSPTSAAKPATAQVKTEVWMALIHGANGIGYFCHSRVPSFDQAAVLKDKAMLAAITDINKQIASLAPVLNSPTVADGATVKSSNTAVPVDLMVKNHGGATYIFAVAMRSGSTTATFTVPSGDQVEVLGENRMLTVSGGKFSDQFESYAVHLYKLSASPQARN